MLSIVWAFICYLTMAIVVTYPLVLSLNTAVADPVDAILNTWIMAFEHHTLLTQPLEFLNTNIFYPHPQTLLYSETLLLPSLLLLPIRLFSDSPLLTHNVLVLMGFALTGTSGYLLGRWLFHEHWAAMVVGGVLAFNSYTLSNMGQAQLLHLVWLPLALLYMAKLLRKPDLRYALMMAFFLAAQFYSVIYYGIFAFLAVGAAGGIGWLFRRYPSRQERLHTAYLMGLGLAIAVLLCLPLALAYYSVSSTNGFARLLAETWPYSASIESWITALPQNLLYGQRLGQELPMLGFYALDALFPGVILLTIAAVGLLLGIVRAWGILRSSQYPARGRFFLWPVFLLVGILFLLVLSFGPYFQQKVLQPNFEQTLPYALIHKWVPGFQALRAPVRFAALVFLGLGVAAAYSVRLVRWQVARMAIFLLLLVEVVLVPANTLYTPTTSNDQQALYAWLATQPSSVYLEFPVYAFGEEGQEARWLESQFQSMNHWHATPVGYSGFFPPRYDELVKFLRGFPRTEVVRFMQALGVEWVVLHSARMDDEAWQATVQLIDERGWDTQRWGDLWLVQLPKLPPEFTTEPPSQQFFIPDVAQASGELALSSIFLATEPTAIVPGSNEGEMHIEWWRGDSLALAVDKIVQAPYFMDAIGASTFSIPVPAQPDAYQLKVFVGEPRREVASGMVNVRDDVAPPEATLLPVRGVEATLVCEGDTMRADVLMQTIGWYDESFTLSGRVLDADGVEVARSTADVEFPPVEPRRNLLERAYYTLPFDALPNANDPSLSLELYAYQWQQSAERIVARNFVHEDGTVASALRLPLLVSANCQR